MKNKTEKRVVMKILSTSYTHAHGFRALKRLHKAVIYNSVLPDELHKLYKALIHFERYIERLEHQQTAVKKKKSNKH